MVMAKKVAVLAVDPVNGMGLFQYLEAFYENGIPYRVYAVADRREIGTNSGIRLTADDTVAALKGHADDYDALVFSCGDAVPVFARHAGEPYNLDLMEVIREFAGRDRIVIGHCAAGMMFEKAGEASGRKLSVHPLAKAAIVQGQAVDEPSAVDGNFWTARDEGTIWTMMPRLLEELKK